MLKPIRAVYRDGVFVPEALPELADGTPVEVTVAGPTVVTDPAERKKILDRLIERMRSNPLPEDAPKFTREEMHERH